MTLYTIYNIMYYVLHVCTCVDACDVVAANARIELFSAQDPDGPLLDAEWDVKLLPEAITRGGGWGWLGHCAHWLEVKCTTCSMGAFSIFGLGWPKSLLDPPCLFVVYLVLISLAPMREATCMPGLMKRVC